MWVSIAPVDCAKQEQAQVGQGQSQTGGGTGGGDLIQRGVDRGDAVGIEDAWVRQVTPQKRERRLARRGPLGESVSVAIVEQMIGVANHLPLEGTGAASSRRHECLE